MDKWVLYGSYICKGFEGNWFIDTKDIFPLRYIDLQWVEHSQKRWSWGRLRCTQSDPSVENIHCTEYNCAKTCFSAFLFKQRRKRKKKKRNMGGWLSLFQWFVDHLFGDSFYPNSQVFSGDIALNLNWSRMMSHLGHSWECKAVAIASTICLLDPTDAHYWWKFHRKPLKNISIQEI